MRITAHGFSYIGRVRARNEDSLLLHPEQRVFAVADGLGGLPGGALASQTAMETLGTALEDSSNARDPALWTRLMHQAVCRAGRNAGYEPAIATTLTLMGFDDASAFLAQLGDSAAFRIRDGEITRLSEIHNVESENQARGLPVDLTSRQRFAITRCLGMETTVVPQIVNLKTRPGDHYLLATDGLTDLLEPDEILGDLQREPDLEEFLEARRRHCYERGAHDHVTAIALRLAND